MIDRALATELVMRGRASVRKGLNVARNPLTYASRIAEAHARAHSLEQNRRDEARDLFDHGLRRLEVADPFLEQALSVCRQLIQERAETAPRMGKHFFAQLLRPQDLELHPSLLGVALNPEVLSVLTQAHGIVPFLESVELLLSFPSDAEPSGSQLWHIDRTDSVVLKQIVYIEDVGPEEGPFTLLPPDQSARVPALTRHYLRDDEIAKYVDITRVRRFEAPAGARAVADTGRCYHHGSRVRKRRHALFCYYNTGYAKFARQGQWRNGFASAWPWSPLQRRALDLT